MTDECLDVEGGQASPRRGLEKEKEKEKEKVEQLSMSLESEFFMLEQIARPIAIKYTDRIDKLTRDRFSRHPGKRIQLASLIAELILQNTIQLAILENDEPGSARGEEILREQYERYKESSIKRWHKQDLKDARRDGQI